MNAADALAQIPPEHRAALLPHLSPSIARAYRTAERDAAVRAAFALMPGDNTTARAVELQRRLNLYLGGAAWKGDRHRAAVTDNATASEVAIHRLATLNDGGELRWRRIIDIAAIRPDVCNASPPR